MQKNMRWPLTSYLWCLGWLGLLHSSLRLSLDHFGRKLWRAKERGQDVLCAASHHFILVPGTTLSYSRTRGEAQGNGKKKYIGHSTELRIGHCTSYRMEESDGLSLI